MGNEDVVAGKIKQIKGKANDAMGAIKGDTGQQIKGKLQKQPAKFREAVGKATRKHCGEIDRRHDDEEAPL